MNTNLWSDLDRRLPASGNFPPYFETITLFVSFAIRSRPHTGLV
jgi:hypothetical protein